MIKSAIRKPNNCGFREAIEVVFREFLIQEREKTPVAPLLDEIGDQGEALGVKDVHRVFFGVLPEREKPVQGE